MTATERDDRAAGREAPGRAPGTRSEGPPSVLGLVLLGAAGGMLYGLLEALGFQVLGLVPGALSWRNGNSFHALWFAPLFYGSLLALLGLALAAAARIARLRRPDVALVLLGAGLGGFLGLSLPGVLWGWACALFGVGIGVQLARAYAKRRAALLPRVPRAAGALAVGVAVLWAGSMGYEALAERSALGPPPADATNVLVLVMDTQRADHLSFHGYPRPTSPRLEAAAREGVVYENAVSHSSWTLPSHATLMTGRPLHEHRAGLMRRPYLDGRHRTLAEAFRDAGYATGGFVANTFWCGRQTGLHRGFARYEDFYESPGDAAARTVLGRMLAYEVLPHLGFVDIPGRKWGEDVNAHFLDWVDGLGARPFFAFLNYMDVHGPLLPPPDVRGRFASGGEEGAGSGKIELGAIEGDIEVPPPDRLRALVDAYDESILHLDTEIGRLLDALRGRGLLERTIVVVTSDHGETWGEHDLMYHGHSLYAEQVRVPLLVLSPGGPRGARVAADVSIGQLPATLTALVGEAVRERFPGPPLPGLGLPEDSAPSGTTLCEVGQRSLVARAWPTSRGWLAAVHEWPWHYVRQEDGTELLFDLSADPDEERDLAPLPEHAERLRAFRERLTGAGSGPSLDWKR